MFVLQIVDGMLIYEINMSSFHEVIVFERGVVNDGAWHNVAVSWSSPRSKAVQVGTKLDYHHAVSGTGLKLVYDIKSSTDQALKWLIFVNLDWSKLDVKPVELTDVVGDPQV